MTNKYYTPELSEFHVGFEYEIMVPEFSKWSKEVFHLNESHIDLIKYVNIQDEFTKNKIRVKYLDKQDLEDCGFEHIADRNFDDYYKHSKTGIGLFAPKSASTFINIVIAEDFLIKHIDIKNINELRKLLKQLGI